MHFSNVLFVAASLASVAVAQTATATPDSGTKGNPNMITDFGITTTSAQAGDKYTVHWTNPQGSAVTVNLRSGNPDNLSKPINLCPSGANTGSCTFTIPKDVASGNQNTIEICQGSDTASCNYSPMFTVGGGTGTAVTGSVESATPSATGEPTETGSPTATGTATGAETITGTSTKKHTTLATEASASSSAESTPSATESEAKSSQTAAAPAPNEGSVARSSSLAMALCVMVAVIYLN